MKVSFPIAIFVAAGFASYGQASLAQDQSVSYQRETCQQIYQACMQLGLEGATQCREDYQACLHGNNIKVEPMQGVFVKKI